MAMRSQRVIGGQDSDSEFQVVFSIMVRLLGLGLRFFSFGQIRRQAC